MDKILQKLHEIATELEKDMQQNGWTGRTVTLKYKLDTYQGYSSYFVYTNTSADDQFSVYPF